MIEGFALGSYVLLLDHTGRLFRDGKATLSREVAEILERLGASDDQWQARLKGLRQERFPGVTLRPVASGSGDWASIGSEVRSRWSLDNLLSDRDGWLPAGCPSRLLVFTGSCQRHQPIGKRTAPAEVVV